MSWETVRDAAMAEADAILRLAQGLEASQWSLPTACGAWTVGAVVSHVASVMHAQQSAIEHMLAGDMTTPEWTNREFDDVASTRAELEAACARVPRVMGQISDDHLARVVPLPFGTFPTAAALDIVLLEYGTHGWDIASALDPGASMSPEAAATVMRLMPAFILFFATPPPGDRAVAYRLEGSTATIDASSTDAGGWVLEPSANAATAVVRGDDSAVALFALGRIGADDDRLDVTGDAAAAFKTWFPGP